MTESEKIFQHNIEDLPNGIEGKTFGAKTIKLQNGKTAAFFCNDVMTFKPDEKSEIEALK